MTGRTLLRGRASVLAAAAFTLATTLTACSSASDEVGSDAQQTIRFVWWGNEDRAVATEKVVKRFEKAHPNIKVQTEFSGYPAYVQKLTTQIAGGNAPDLLQLDRPTFGEYQQKHQLAELTPYVGKSLKSDDIADNLLAGGKADGKQFAMPAGLTTQVFVYDKDLYKKAGVTVPEKGWTWKQFATDMAKVRAGSGRAGSTDFGWAVDWFESWLHQHGKQLYTSDRKLGFTQHDLEQFWGMLASMRKEKGLTAAEDTTKMDGSAQNSALVAKRSGSEIAYDSSITSYASTYQGNLDYAALPSDSGTESGMAALPPVYYGIAKTSSHKDAAALLLDFMINDPEAGKVLGTTRGTPPNSKVAKSVCASATGADKQTCDFQEEVSDKLGASDTWLWPSGSSAVKTDFQRVYDDVIFGKTSASAGAAKVVGNAKQSLGQ